MDDDKWLKSTKNFLSILIPTCLISLGLTIGWAYSRTYTKKVPLDSLFLRQNGGSIYAYELDSLDNKNYIDFCNPYFVKYNYFASDSEEDTSYAILKRNLGGASMKIFMDTTKWVIQPYSLKEK